MSRTSAKTKDALETKSGSSESTDSEADEETMEADREETPDLYRNSSLGM